MEFGQNTTDNTVMLPAAEAARAAAADAPVKRLAFGDAELKAAQERLKKYQAGKANYDNNIIENEDWYKLRHWRNFKNNPETVENKRQDYNAEPVSAWLLNSILNKHADALDNYPEPAVLPRSRDDEEVAKNLSSILPVILDNCRFEAVYSNAWWDKLKNGCGCYGVFYNTKLYNGVGDIDIRRIDMLSLYWEPGVQDIQDSKDVFFITLTDNDVLESQYPELKGKLRDSGENVMKYRYDDHVDTSGKSCEVDMYYKVSTPRGEVLHYCKWVDDTILFASENEPKYANGFYQHGKYPFILDVLYEIKGTPAGFGFVDIMRSPQEYIDRLSGGILDNVMNGSRPRYFAKDSANINEEEFLDHKKQIVHAAGNLEDVLKPIVTPDLPAASLSVLQFKVDELKETSGNRDFSQGSTSAGVTAGSAIAALMEAGSKTSRDLSKASYRTFAEICEMVIELVRQFYDTPRTFRILGETGEPEYIEFTNAGMHSQDSTDFNLNFASKEPIFDIKVKAKKSNPFSRMSQNELALQFYQLGFFNPQMADQVLPAVEMMDFEGKQKITDMIRKNGTMFEQLQQAQQTNLQLAQLLAERTGETRPLAALQQQMGMQPTAAAQSPRASRGSSGGGVGSSVEKAQRAAAETTAVR